MLDRLRCRGDDGGFSLIESVVALAIASVVFTALAAAMISSLKATVYARQAQQASDVVQQSMEQLRAMGFDALVMRSTDLGVNDPLPLAACTCFDPTHDVASGAATEPLVVGSSGSVSPHEATVTVNSTVYTLRSYVTRPADSTGVGYKRITVVGTWSSLGQAHMRLLSSLVSNARSGLPLPDYKFTLTTPATACVSPGGTLVYGFTIKNNGARDSFTLGTSATSGPTWTLYLDDGTSSVGSWGADDSQVSSASGAPLVGPIEVNTSLQFWAVANLDSGAPVGTYANTFTATSASDPSVSQSLATTSQVASVCTSSPSPSPSASPSPSPSPTAVAPPQPASTCTTTLPSVSTGNGVTPTTYYLANGATNTTNTTASALLPIARLAPPVSTTLWDYSTDLAANTAGRYLSPSGTSVATAVDWRYQLSSATKIVGNGVLSLWAAPVSGNPADPLVVTVTVRQLNSSGTVLATFTSTAYGSGAWGCSGPQNFGVSIPFGNGNGTSFSANDFIDVQVSVSGAPAELAYDTTTFSSNLTLPIKSGG
jgi:prepilin-type N-terminal cleavage/methylation domain-containing protein